ncbi:MAG: glycosyltransferase family 39 protein [Chloroflexi bacterium]|nr:glycosyltransferase family 39 protein [Chloroflexota bacterium]
MVHVRIRFTDVNRREWLTLALFTAGLLVAFLMQRVIYESGASLAAGLIYFSAFLFLVAAFGNGGADIALPLRLPHGEITQTNPANPARWLFMLPAYVFALIAFFEARSNEFTLLGTSAWLTALALFLIAAWEGSPLEVWRGLREKLARLFRRDKAGQRTRWLLIALMVIFGIGAFFYFYRLDAAPAEMTSDHAEKLLDTYDILQGRYSIFFERNTGREPLQFYANALVVALGIAPLDMLALKVVGACAGVLTIPAVFLLAREMFDDEVGLIAAFLFAVSIFPLALARIGLRYPLSPLFVAWTLFFLLRALRRQSRNDFLIAGLLMGVGLNGYSPFRVVVLLAMLWLGLWVLFDLNVGATGLQRFIGNSALMYGAALLVFVPLLGYISLHPELFAYRMATRLTSLEEPIQGDPLAIFLNNNLRAFGMFNAQGDVVWVSALPNEPVVDFLLGACFFAGVVYAAYRLLRYREHPFALLFVALLVLWLPSTLALAFPDENPSVVRTGGIAPFVMILAALPLVQWRRQFARLGYETFGVVVVGLVLLGIGVTNFDLYFSRYAEQYRRAAWNSTEIAETLREFALAHNDWEHIYIVSAPHWVDYRAVGIHLGNFDFHGHLVENVGQFEAQARDLAPKIYALKNQDLESLNLLERLYPGGIAVPMDSQTPGREYVVFYTQGQ